MASGRVDEIQDSAVGGRIVNCFLPEEETAVGERVTSRRLVLLFFLVALIAWQRLEFLLFVLLSLSCRHCGQGITMLEVE